MPPEAAFAPYHFWDKPDLTCLIGPDCIGEGRDRGNKGP